MNAVIDEDLHRSLSSILSSLNFKVFDIRDHGLRGKPDDKIFAFAQNKKAVLFSADLGFSNILRFPLGKHFGICILRFPNELSTQSTNQEIYKLLKELLPEDYFGNLIILSPGKRRIRRQKTPKKEGFSKAH